MALRLRSINAPALLRALADVLEQHPHCHPQLIWDFPSDLTDWTRIRSHVPESVVDASFSTRITIGQPALNLAMAAAYKRHGGNAEAFLTDPELTQLETAP